MKNRKSMLVLICVALLIVSIVVGTLAYFTDSEQATNTFTVGQVHIDLNESDVDEDGNKKQNDYHLLPGHTYVKNPTVTILKGSDDAYVRMLVKPSKMAALEAAFPNNKGEDGTFLLQNLVSGWNPAIWEFAGYADGVYEFRYHKTVAAPEKDVDLESLFEKVVIPGEIDNDNLAALEGIEINVVAHAIQAAGFDTAKEAWDAFDDQHPAEPEEQETTAPPIDDGPEW